jgi:protein-tyrosine phosphatase
MVSSHTFRLLLHSETPDGTVVPIWEEVQPENVVVLKDVMASRKATNDVELQYNRIPVTAERPPDFSDLSDLIDVVLRSSTNTPIVVNCQLGRGRSTLSSVSDLICRYFKFYLRCRQIILLLIQQWLESHRTLTPTSSRTKRSLSMMSMPPMEPITKIPNRHSYQVINSA